ncbi:MAG: penicillin-binding protein 1C [Synergistaceae bacterium]|nr:penicillin-binding protein 1C [Synergistaceae bacterium]
MIFYRAKRALTFTVAVIAALSLFFILYIDREYGDFTPPDVSRIVLDSDGRVLAGRLSLKDEWCIPVSLDKMGRWISAVAIEIEDKRFYSHRGVDFIALFRAVFDNLRSMRVVSGASTITSQLIRISNARPRTFRTKLIEFWGAARIESQKQKNEILELYLNFAPFGGNIRGVEAASRAYFKKSASDLSLGESTLLISLLRAPSRLRPDRYPERAKKERDYRLLYLFERGAISRENMEAAQKEPVSAQRYSFPRNANMAAKHILENAQFEMTIKSTINSHYQSVLETALKAGLVGLPERITSSGIVVNNDGDVLAYVGNARHGEDVNGSWVDCGSAPRSPGSTLKPFVYTRAFERGFLTPASLLADTPLSFRGSAPRNFDREHRGPVSARSALSLSLNTPAVRVLRMIGYPDALEMYGRLQFKYIDKSSSHYADSLILGGCEATVIELAAAYSTLARGGSFNALKWTSGDVPERTKIFSEEAAWITTNILQDERRLIPLYQQLFREKNQLISFKTGTSHGLRDAWCAGYSKRLTAVVWFGIPDGSGESHLVGLDIAAPVMLNVFKELWGEDGNAISKTPEGIFTRKVCALSGAPAGKYCRVIVNDYAIKDISPFSICGLHKFVDGKIIVQLPDELSAWEQFRNRVERIGDGVRITRPTKGAQVLSRRGEVVRIFFSAEGRPPYYWYMDGKFAGVDEKGDGVFFNVSAGRHRASVLSGERNDSAVFEVLRSDRLTLDEPENILN